MKPTLAISMLVLVAFVPAHALAVTRYVDLNSPNPTSPYTDWSIAATNIQDAVDIAEPGDTVLVTNGVYETGGRAVSGTLTNRVAITKAITVQSVNGPQATIIQGIRPTLLRCAYLTNGATLSGFTLTNGAADNGGGVWCATVDAAVSNCVLTGNTANNGGGAYGGTLIGCVFTNNQSLIRGGGAANSDLRNCMLVGNSSVGAFGGGGAAGGTLIGCLIIRNIGSSWGGGTFESHVENCTVSENIGDMIGGVAGGYARNSIIVNNTNITGSWPNWMGVAARMGLDYCCTLPDPNGGGNSGNITNDPAFIDPANGDFRLQSNSPCINSGNNDSITNLTDLDGNPRIVGGTVDIGAYEFQSPSSVLSYAWAQQYGLPTDGSADATDNDGDGMDNYGEWRSGTVPTNSVSVLKVTGVTNGPSGALISWQSVTNRNYWLERTEELGGLPSFQSIATNLPGVNGTKTYVDATATNDDPFFYRVGVQ